MKRFSGIDKNKRSLDNRLLLIRLVKSKILKKSNMGHFVK